LRIGGIKIFAYGALGPRTAAMIAPYENEPNNSGIVVTDKETVMEYGQQASANGLSLTVHAIGDRANHDILDVYEALRRDEKRREENRSYTRRNRLRHRILRHRIEHVQVLHPADFARLAKLDVIASMQPIHATSDMKMADRYWGGRAEHSYAWRTVLESGALLVFGSDAPVERIEPLLGLHAAVTRRRADGSPGADGWYPEQKLTMVEALHAFTLAAAITGGQEQHQGSITPGKLADLTLFDRDLFTIPPDELLDVGIAGTMVGGTFRYRTW
jgi:predicted amidohydrolase YtcJ